MLLSNFLNDVKREENSNIFNLKKSIKNLFNSK